MTIYPASIDRRLYVGSGLTVAFDPAALSTWPSAVIPAGLPAATKKAQYLETALTAVLPMTTANSTRVQVLNAAGTTPATGTWSEALATTTSYSGVSYFRPNNWDISTGVYGWRNPYSTISNSSYLNLGNASDLLWASATSFDVVFRLERSDWLAIGDASYSRYVGIMRQNTILGWRIFLRPQPTTTTSNTLTFTIPVTGNLMILTTTQADLGATDNVPIWVKCSRLNNTMTISRSIDGRSWTSVATRTITGTLSSPSAPSLLAGGNTGSFYNGRYNVDGTLSVFRYYVDGSLVADADITSAPTVAATSWTASTTGKTVTRTGGTLLGGATGTLTPRFTFTNPAPLSDFVLNFLPMLSGEVNVDSVNTFISDRIRRGLGIIHS